MKRVLLIIIAVVLYQNIDAALLLAMFQKMKYIKEKEEKLSADSLRAEKGDVVCQLSCARRYWAKEQYPVARKFLKKAIKQKNDTAMVYLAEMDYYGYGIPQADAVAAKKNALRALKYGNKESYFILGKMYYDGLVVERDYEKALWFFSNTPQTSKNIKLSRYYIAKCYRYGRGVKVPNLRLSNEYLNESKCERYQWWDENIQCIEECYISEKILDVMKADIGVDLGTILQKGIVGNSSSMSSRLEQNMGKHGDQSKSRKAKGEQKNNDTNIWLEAANTQLNSQAIKDAMSYEDVVLELEKEQLDKRLSRIRAEKESYENLVSEEAKNVAPTFGLR